MKFYRLKLSSLVWNKAAFTKWQKTRDFSRALLKAAELGIEATIEETEVPD